MNKDNMGLIIKLAVAVLAVAAAVCVIIVYSNEIIEFLSGAKEKIKAKLPKKGCCDCGCDDAPADEDFADYADV